MQIKMSGISEDVNFIIDTLEQDGFQAYAVGGCVRDLLLGKVPEDWDICTSAKPEQTKACFPDFPVLETGLQHGTITIRLHHVSYEITTFRMDGDYRDHRRPASVQFVEDLHTDLARRDFTINAMALHPKKGLFDFFGGKDDLGSRVIRCVGNPADRFGEDALRVMRALRFTSVYEFEIEKNTSEALFFKKEGLAEIAAERIQAELCKMLLGRGIRQVLREYWQIFCVFIPEIQPLVGFPQNNPHHCFDVWEHTAEAVACADSEKVLRLTMLFHDMGKPSCHIVGADGLDHFYGHSAVSRDIADKVLNRLKFDRITADSVVELVRYHDAEVLAQKKAVKRWLNRIGEAQFRRLLLVKQADMKGQSQLLREEKEATLQQITLCLEAVISEKQCFSMKDLHINGTDLMGIGVPQGREIGVWLHWALEEVLEERLENKREVLLKAVVCHSAKIRESKNILQIKQEFNIK